MYPALSILAYAPWCLKVWHSGATGTRLRKNGTHPAFGTAKARSRDTASAIPRRVDFWLFSAGMRFALLREKVVGPFILGLQRRLGHFAGGGSRTGVRWAIPIRGGIGNSPHISVVIKRNSNKKIFPVSAQRQAAGYSARGAATARQVAQQYWGFERQAL